MFTGNNDPDGHATAARVLQVGEHAAVGKKIRRIDENGFPSSCKHHLKQDSRPSRTTRGWSAGDHERRRVPGIVGKRRKIVWPVDNLARSFKPVFTESALNSSYRVALHAHHGVTPARFVFRRVC